MRRSQGFGEIPQQAKRKMTQDYCGHNASVRTDALLAQFAQRSDNQSVRCAKYWAIETAHGLIMFAF